MINTKIQSVLEGILSSFAPIIVSDTLPACPFCVHDAKITATLRDKEGIYGHVYELGVLVVGDSAAQIDPKVESIIDTLEATTDGVIEKCSFETMSGLQYDEETAKYSNQLNFTVQTNNL